MIDLSESAWVVPADFVRAGDRLNVLGQYEEVAESHIYTGTYHVEEVPYWEISTFISEAEWDFTEYPHYGWQKNDDYDGPEFIAVYDTLNHHTFGESDVVEIVNHDEKLIHPATLLPIRWWVAVYDVDRAFGGQEEGGWWFDTGELIRSFPCKDREEAEAVREKLRESFPKTDTRYSMAKREGDFDVVIAKHQPAESYPERTPHYS